MGAAAKVSERLREGETSAAELLDRKMLSKDGTPRTQIVKSYTRVLYSFTQINLAACR